MSLRKVDVRLDNCGVRMARCQVKMANCGVKLHPLKINVLEENLVKVKDVVMQDERESNDTNNESDDQEDVDSLEDIFNVTLKKEVPLWAEPNNCYEALVKQEDGKGDIVKTIFARINLEDLDDEEMYKVPPKKLQS